MFPGRSPEGITISLNFNGENSLSRSRWFRKPHQSPKPGVKENTSVERENIELRDTESCYISANPNPEILLTDPHSSLLLQFQSDLSNQLADQFNCPEFDLGLDILPQECMLTNRMENSLNIIKEESQMDCEGFQDLNQWCSVKGAGSPQSPSCTDINHCYLQENLGTERNQELAYYGLFEESIDGINKEEETIDIFENPMVINLNDNALMDVYDNPNNIVLYVNDPSTSTSPEMSNSDFANYGSPSVTMSLNKWELNATSNVLLQGMESRNVMLSAASDFDSTLYRSMQITKLPVSEEIKCNVEMSSTKVHENNAAVIDTIIFNAPTISAISPEMSKFSTKVLNKNKLTLNLNTTNINYGNNNNYVIDTPGVLKTVEDLENDRLMRSRLSATYDMKPVVASELPEFSSGQNSLIAAEDFTPPVTPAKPTRKRTRRDSEDSDATYNPENDTPQTLKKKRKPSSPPRISFITRKFLDQLSTPVKRGRPSKRRDSIVSNETNNYDDNCSAVSSEDKYRDQRERNNEASRRSRFNKKLKDIQMEEMAVELEERNKYLRIQEGKLSRKRDLLKNYLFNSISNNNQSLPIK